MKKQTAIKWEIIVIALSGAVLFIVSFFFNNTSFWRLSFSSIGCSLLATALSSAIINRRESIDETTIITLTKQLEQCRPNNRILFGKHLKQCFNTMVAEAEENDHNNIVQIDVIGMRLLNFWQEQIYNKKIILHGNKPNTKFRIRMIVQDPTSTYIDGMAQSEGLIPTTVRDNIKTTTDEVKKLRIKSTVIESIEIRWVAFPASITITRVGNQMYARTRLSDYDSKYSDEEFFERYSLGDHQFDRFIKYFEEMWDKAAVVNNNGTKRKNG